MRKKASIAVLNKEIRLVAFQDAPMGNIIDEIGTKQWESTYAREILRPEWALTADRRLLSNFARQGEDS